MRIIRFAALFVAVFLVLSVPGSAFADHKRPKHYKKGQIYCPSRVLVVGNVVVQSGRCYVLAVVRDGSGTFLAFVNPKVKVPARRVRLDSDRGRKIKAQIIYLVPIQATGFAAVSIPLNTIQLVQIQERHEHDDDDDDEDDEDDNRKKGKEKVVLVISGVPIPNLTVTFVVRF